MDTYDFNAPHTSPILRGRIDGGWIRENGEGRCDGVLDWLENDGKTEPLRRDPRYPALIARLRIAAENE